MTENKKPWIWAVVIIAAILIWHFWEQIEKKIKGDTTTSTATGATGSGGSGGSSGSALKAATLTADNATQSSVAEPQHVVDPSQFGYNPKRTYQFGDAQLVFNNFSQATLAKTAFK